MVHQGGADLPEELVVVVDLLGVRDLDPGALLERVRVGRLDSSSSSVSMWFAVATA